MYRKPTKDPTRIAASLLEAGSENSFVGRKEGGRRGGWGEDFGSPPSLEM